MTDEELLALLDRKTPEELTAGEIEMLRARLSESPQVREALAARLRLEADLAAALGRVNLSVDDLLAESRVRRESLAMPILGLLGCLLLIGLTATALYVSSRPDAADEERIAAADGAADNPSDELASADGAEGRSSGDETTGGGPHGDSDGSQDSQPTITPAAAVKFPLRLSAAEFARGNVAVDKEDFGTPEEPVVVSGEQLPAFVEYEFEVPRAGPHRLRLRYAAFDGRPLEMSLNGEPTGSRVAGQQTGGNLHDKQTWVDAGTYELVAGRNVLRLSTSFKFPYLSRLEIDQPPVVASVEQGEPDQPGDEPAAPGEQPPAEAKPATPWQAVVEADEIPTFAESCFGSFDREVSLPRRDDLHDWVAPVEGYHYAVSEVDTRYGRCAAIDGLVRWKSPWLEDSALRLALENYHRLKIHFFHGAQGVSLVYYESERFRWSAYTTTRQPGAARPERYYLTATDAGRCNRTEIRFGGPFELRYKRGDVILSRGDVELLRAPLPGPPEEVYLDGRAVFQGVELVRASGYPDPPAPLPIAAEVERPAELDWREQLDEKAQVERREDGAIRLTADGAARGSWIAARLPQTGLHLIELEVEQPTAGSGVFLGRADAAPQEVLRFAGNRRDGSLGLTMRGNDDLRELDFGNLDDKTVPAASPERQWIRLLFGAGLVRWWMSSDGVHWAEPELPWSSRPGDVQFVALHCAARAPDCGITLRRLRLLELPVLTSLAAQELREQALAAVADSPPDKWQERLAESRPKDIDKPQWRRASAWAVLSRGASRELAHEMLDGLIDDPTVRAMPPEQRFSVLDEAALLYDARSQFDDAQRLIEHYFAVANDAEGELRPRPFSLVRRPLMMSPMLDVHFRTVSDPPLIRIELIQLTCAQQWADLVAFCRRLHFFQQDREAPLVAWAEATAMRNAGTQLAAGDIGRMKDEWRQPVVEEFSKQAYNVMAELEALLASDAYDAAARMVTSLDPETLNGVAPAAHDRQLLVSLPAAVRLAIRRHPQLAEVIQEKYGPLAQLRIRQAAAAGDARTVELAAVQFESTDAAAEARQWLGDRALATGWFARAEAEYRRAAQSAGILMRKGLEARLRLAAAMQGRDEGRPATDTVQIGEMLLSAAEFESLVEEMRRRGEANTSGETKAGGAAPPLPSPGDKLEVQRKERLDGPLGQNAKAEVTRHVRRHGVPWVDRQLATAAAGDVLYVSNRFQVAAFDAKTGKRRWRSESPEGGMMRSQEWGLTPMPPLVEGNRVYARMLYGDSPAITALDRESGKLLWSARRPTQEAFVSDPLFAQGRLLAFSLVRTEQRESVLRLVTLDVATGETASQHDLLRLRDSWWTRRFCAAASLDDSLVVNLGGACLCCDLGGSVRWVRRQWVLPAEEESTWVEQRFQAPWLHNGRLYLAQPGVRTIECVEPETGQLVWSHVVPNVQGIVGIAQGKVVLETSAGFLALAADSGERLWRCRADERLDASACDEKHLLFSRRIVSRNSRRRDPRYVGLSWVSLADGRLLETAEFASLEERQVHLAGMTAFADRLFAFYGVGNDEPQRELVEFIAH